MGLRLLRYAALPSTDFVAEVVGARAKEFQEVLNDYGNGSFEVLNDDEDLDLLDEGTVVKYELDDAIVFGIVIGPHEIAEVAEKDAERTKLSGPGLLDLLNQAVVYPSAGIDAALDQDAIELDRLFAWPSPQFDDSGFGDVNLIAELVGATRHNLVPIVGPPVGMPRTDVDPMAPSYWWIWGPSGDASSATEQVDSYFRGHLTGLADVTRVRCFWAIDNIGELYVNGVRRDSLLNYDLSNFLEAHSFEMTLPAGDSTFAVYGRNMGISPFANPGSLALLVVALDGDSEGEIIFGTDDSWVCLEDVPPPGMTPGQAFRIPFDEAQARGSIPFLSLGFDDVNDSNGDPWPIDANIATKVGTKLGTFALELSVSWWDLWMDPDTLTLNAWNAGGRGAPRSLELVPVTGNDPRTGNLAGLTRRRG